MPTINTEVEFYVQCSVCSRTLNATITQKRDIVLSVEPCDNCMDDARSEGYVDGMNDETTRISRMP